MATLYVRLHLGPTLQLTTAVAAVVVEAAAAQGAVVTADRTSPFDDAFQSAMIAITRIEQHHLTNRATPSI